MTTFWQIREFYIVLFMLYIFFKLLVELVCKCMKSIYKSVLMGNNLNRSNVETVLVHIKHYDSVGGCYKNTGSLMWILRFIG